LPKLATAPFQLFCNLKTIKSGHLKSSSNDGFFFSISSDGFGSIIPYSMKLGFIKVLI